MQPHGGAGRSSCRHPAQRTRLAMPGSRGALSLSPRSQGLTEFCCCRRCAAVAPPCCMQLSCCYRALALTVAITHSPSACGCCDRRSLPSLSSLRPRQARQMWATAPGVLTTLLSAGDAPVVVWHQRLSLPAPASGVSTHLPDHSGCWLCCTSSASLWIRVVDSLTASSLPQ